MKRLALSLLFVFLLNIQSIACVILIYHKIGDNRTPSTNVSKQLFIRQMEYLKQNNYTVMPLRELVYLIKEGKKLSQRCVVLTFDDGYRSVYENAFPTLKKLHFAATVFLPTEAIEKHYPDYMSIKQIKEMMQYNIDFQSHSHSHPRFTNPPSTIPHSRYADWIAEDIKKSINFFIKEFGYKPYAFAIPYGDYNKTVIDVARRLGFEAILTQDATAIGAKTPLWLMPRQPILGKYWSTMQHFKEILKEKYLPIKQHIPPAGSTTNSKLFGAILDNVSRYDRNSFMVYVSQLGWQRAKTEGNMVYIKTDAKLTKAKQRIGVMAKNNGRIYKNLWMVWMAK
ncbi:polysaccharide deacetylase family protein [Hippea sp. KM1]|uniref:polysaccharide deacetylase family protein n=1 Tax=Hippea sp. KM1 TaxID=944481 RepID=UPI00046D1EDF|nr:polysaccharide deacetylase family protein [Hippea sp. KM1]